MQPFNIFNAIVSLFAIIINVVSGVLPGCQTGVTNYISSGFSTLAGLLGGVAILLPMDTVIQVLQYIIAIEIIVLLWTAIRWIASLLTGRVK